MTRIDGQQARQLLDGTTPGPWEWLYDQGFISLRAESGEPIATDLTVADSDLLAAAPDLAGTVAWLYGKQLTTDRDGDYYAAPGGGYTYAEDGLVDANVSQGPFTADEAVDLARALLAAAQEARDGDV